MLLADLGLRICIMGPSGSGKSTLATAIGRAGGLHVVHLDLLHHAPGSQWRPRPHAEFLQLHDAAIAGARWAMDGNYSACLPQRLARATGAILLDVPVAVSLWRYVRRELFEAERRIGGLPGARAGVRWEMIRHIAITSPANRRRYARLFDSLALPCLRLTTAPALRRFYAANGLQRPSRA